MAELTGYFHASVADAPAPSDHGHYLDEHPKRISTILVHKHKGGYRPHDHAKEPPDDQPN